MIPTRAAAVVAVLAATTAAQALVALAMLSLAAIAPEVARALAIEPALVGWWISLAYGGAMLTSLGGSALVRRLGATRTTQVALALVGLGALSAASGRLVLVAAAAALVGLGYGLTNPGASHLLVRSTTPANRNLVFSVKQTGVPLGGTIAGLMAPPVALAFGWPAVMAVVAVLAVVLAVALAPVRAAWDADRDPSARFTEHPLAGLALIWGDPRLRALSLAGFAYAAVQLSLSTFLVTMLVKDLGWSLVEAGVLLSTVQVTGVVGRIALGVVADRVLRSSLAALVAGGVATALFALATGALGPDSARVAVTAVLVAFGAAALGWNGVYLAGLTHGTPAAQIPRITGASLFFTYGGVLVGPPAFAALVPLVGSYTAVYALSALPALLGVAWLMRAKG
ncbi:MAG: MFS transporter [Magnetospirillum sp.]|nr:MFS transporter [Magnetospirillum sp.]